MKVVIYSLTPPDRGVCFLQLAERIVECRDVTLDSFFDSSGEFMGRIILKTMMPLDAWNPPRDLIAILREMVSKGEL